MKDKDFKEALELRDRLTGESAEKDKTESVGDGIQEPSGVQTTDSINSSESQSEVGVSSETDNVEVAEDVPKASDLSDEELDNAIYMVEDSYIVLLKEKQKRNRNGNVKKKIKMMREDITR